VISSGWGSRPYATRDFTRYATLRLPSPHPWFPHLERRDGETWLVLSSFFLGT
jgi:hypothetical protein